MDCTELFIEMPASYRIQSATFSSYKHYNTAKGLVGISPNDAIIFVNDFYARRFSDWETTKDSGIYGLFEPDDSIMAYRGFIWEDDLPEGISLNIPPFLNMEPQLSLINEKETRHVTSVRVHVERAIERLKNVKMFIVNFPLVSCPRARKNMGYM